MKNVKRALLIGAGRGGKALLELFHANGGVCVTGVADKQDDAPGMKLAKELGIATASDFTGLLEKNNYDMVINATGDVTTSRNIRGLISQDIEILEGFSAKLLWELVEKQREAKEKEKSLGEELQSSNKELKALSVNLEEKVLQRTTELKKLNMDLERSNRYKSEFITNMSHELRTPLNSIIGFSEMLLNEPVGDLNIPQTKYLNNVCTSGKHLLQLINSILDIAKIESGRLKLNLEEFKVSGAISEVDSIIGPLLDKNGISFSKEIAKDISVTADKIKFKQILYNLIGNAAKFTDRDGRITLSISSLNEDIELPVEIRNIEGYTLLKVEDTGVGIKESDIDRIFREFEQVDSSLSRNYEGVGLGLPLTKRFIEMHGGFIWVESEVGKGSCFSFVIPPLSIGEAASKGMPESATPFDRSDEVTAEDAVREMPPYVLVIEDDRATMELLTLHLSNAGYRVAHAYDGVEGIAKAKEIKPFVILLDIMLPKKDGWEVLQELQNDIDTKNIPVIINSIVNNKELGFTLGAADYLVKPLSKDELIKSVKEISILSGKRKQPVNILIIDSDPKVLKSLIKMLDGGSFTTHGALSGEEGFELAVDLRPDIIILALTLQDMTGLDVISKLKDTPATKEIPTLVLTEREIDRNERLMLLAQIEGIMQKEIFSKNELLTEIRKMELIYPKRAGLMDGITGLFNIHYLNIRLFQEMSRANRYKEPITLMLMGLDNFKIYAEKNGVIIGDSALRKTAEILQNGARSSDVPVKLDEGEFAIILPCTMAEQAMVISCRFKDVIESYSFSGEEVLPTGKLTSCIGIATSNADVPDPEELIMNAKKALKMARDKGMNHVVSYNDMAVKGD